MNEIKFSPTFLADDSENFFPDEKSRLCDFVSFLEIRKIHEIMKKIEFSLFILDSHFHYFL